MSYHILHIVSHGSYLRKERGMLICENKDTSEVKKIPIEDLKAIVLAAKGVVLSDYLISSLLKQDAIILHCDEKFLPIGITSSLHRVIKKEALLGQINFESTLHIQLWRRILTRKILNHAQVLKYCDRDYSYLTKQARSKQPNEAISARYYWRRYFHALNLPQQRRKPQAVDSMNAKLNYGYAVMGSLCHRSIIIHGLNPVFGVYHKSRYRSFPLTYDLMEPMRAFIEKALYDFMQDEENTMQLWQRFCAQSWQNIEVRHKKYSLKLIDAVDLYIESVVRCFAQNNIQSLWVPKLKL